MSLLVVKTTPAKQAVNLVRTILGTTSSGLTTQEIFKLVAKHEAIPPAPVVAAAPASDIPKPKGFQAKAKVVAPIPESAIPSVR